MICWFCFNDKLCDSQPNVFNNSPFLSSLFLEGVEGLSGVEVGTGGVAKKKMGIRNQVDLFFFIVLPISLLSVVSL